MAGKVEKHIGAINVKRCREREREREKERERENVLEEDNECLALKMIKLIKLPNSSYINFTLLLNISTLIYSMFCQLVSEQI